MQFKITKRGCSITFESFLSDGLVREQLLAMPGDFPQELAEKFERRGWSPAQQAWAHYLVYCLTHPEPKPERTDGLKPIVDMFQSVGRKLKHPRLTFFVNGQTIALSLAGARSRAPGCINVTDGKPYGQNTYHGRIMPDGSTAIGDAGVLAFLQDFATDPAAKAREYGHASGACCMCNLTLTDEVSRALGYGPVCAKNWGLPWNAKAAAAVA